MPITFGASLGRLMRRCCAGCGTGTYICKIWSPNLARRHPLRIPDIPTRSPHPSAVVRPTIVVVSSCPRSNPTPSASFPSHDLDNERISRHHLKACCRLGHHVSWLTYACSPVCPGSVDIVDTVDIESPCGSHNRACRAGPGSCLPRNPLLLRRLHIL